jgi:predicted nucleotidyltransferase
LDLSHPARDLFGENEERLLSRLATLPQGESGNRLHQLAGTSSARSTQRALARLERVGLVSADSVGPARLYKLNRRHVLWDTVFSGLAGAARTEQRLGEIVQRALADHASVAVFGSFARGDAGPESDIDLVIVWTDDVDFDTQDGVIQTIETEVRLLTGNDVQILTVDARDLRRMAQADDPLLESWRRDARQLTPGASLADLITEASR